MAVLWVTETFLQWQNLALSLILTWQSPPNAAPGSEPAKLGWNFTFLHRGGCSDLDMCRQRLSPAQTSLPFLQPRAMGAALLQELCGGIGLWHKHGLSLPKSLRSANAEGTTGMDMMGCWLGWRIYVSKPWQGGQAEENVQGLV